MRKIPGMLQIGSTCRKVGKTDLAVSIIERFRQEKIISVKVTPVHTDRPCPSGQGSCGACASLEGPFEIEEENSRTGDKDTQRLLNAGAERAIWLRARTGHLEQGMERLVKMIGPGRVWLVESCSVREVVEPDLFILVGRDKPCTWKASARQVRKHADRFITTRGTQDGTDFGGFCLDELRLSDGRWSMPTKASAIILAGGKSSRMGRDKSLMELDGRPLISVLVGQLIDWFDEVIISSNTPEKYDFCGVRVVADRQAGQGPLMGIASALDASKSARNLVLACDIPIVDRALIRSMLSGLSDADVVVPQNPTGYLEPLYAAYRKDIAEKMFETLRSGKRRIVHAFDGLRVREIGLQQHEVLPNLNTPQDWHKWKVEQDAIPDKL